MLVLKVVDKNFRSSRNFKYPRPDEDIGHGVVKCPDWNSNPCAQVSPSPPNHPCSPPHVNYKSVLTSGESANIVALGDRAIVITRENSCVKVGEHAIVVGEYNSTLEAGCFAYLRTGCYSQLTTGIRSRLTAGNSSKLKAGRNSTLEAGDHSILKAGEGSSLEAGRNSTLEVDFNTNPLNLSTVKAGDCSTIIFKFKKNNRIKHSIFYVGEDSVKSNTWYTFDYDTETLKEVIK
jgi:hypothetical protein